MRVCKTQRKRAREYSDSHHVWMRDFFLWSFYFCSFYFACTQFLEGNHLCAVFFLSWRFETESFSLYLALCEFHRIRIRYERREEIRSNFQYLLEHKLAAWSDSVCLFQQCVIGVHCFTLHREQLLSIWINICKVNGIVHINKHSQYCNIFFCAIGMNKEGARARGKRIIDKIIGICQFQLYPID